MADNIFDATLDVDNDVKVNNFDWSHANNLTTQIGRITPIFCDLVPAKTSFRVNPRFGLQFMPMVFPIQTRMKARISWYRYPLRALWKDYKDFIGNFREGLEEPYLNINTEDRLKKMCGTGSLGDYLGLPSTIVGEYGSTFSYMPTFSDRNVFYVYNFGDELTAFNNYVNVFPTPTANAATDYFGLIVQTPSFQFSKIVLTLSGNSSIDGLVVYFYDKQGILLKMDSLTKSGNVYTLDDIPSIDSLYHSFLIVFQGSPSTVSKYSDGNWRVTGVTSFTLNYDSITSRELTLSTSPWYNSESANKDKQQKLLAYSHRAYEGIYNAFMRDNRNNPYYLNGQVQYNQWIPTDAGGEDNELYELHYANWEKDFLTTAVQSPQQGNAPLVGITTYTQTVDNGDGTRTELIKTALVDEDGKKYGLSFKSSDEGLEGVEYVELDNGTAVRQARSLYDLATSGISIPDLRMVNCYQKFLELNMRKGYSYKDIVEGRFAVKVRYADLLLPEFFGGVSRDIDVNSVTQTVDQNVAGQTNDYDKALGSQAGLAGVRGEANANIECFCDEESIIMGILVVTPLPVYTQLLPKHFTYRGLMEHYQPEFNLIGFQPIKYNEVCPIQAYNDNPASLTETFGYNRPWYEYCQKYDVAHGLFRTDLSNFLMHRVFDKKPELAKSFLLVDPEQVTDVFAVTQTTDKIYGQIWLDITCKLPIARVAIPRLD